MTYLYLLPLNSWLLIFPWDLLCDYTMGTIPLLTSVADLRNLAVLIFVGCMLKFGHKALFAPEAEERSVLTMVSQS